MPQQEPHRVPALPLFCPQEVLDWFESKGLTAYSISAGQSLLYNNVFPKHKERLGKKVRAAGLQACAWLGARQVRSLLAADDSCARPQP